VTSLALAVGVFLVYAWGACPSIYVGDSGELVAAVHVLGIPHPSGYPLYVLLGKVFTLLFPWGSVAYRMSLFSSACSAACVGLLHCACRRFGMGSVPASTGALFFAFAPSHWAEANIQRVYSLNALFVALATLLALEWHTKRRPALLIAAFGVCGLGAANHTFMAVYGLVLLALSLPGQARCPGGLRVILSSVAAASAGLATYLFLPLRSRADPPLDWGNPQTLDRFLAVVTRRDFWERRWLSGAGDLFPIVLDYVRSLGAELHWAGAMLAVFGLAWTWRRGRFALALLLGVMAANLAVVALHGSRSDIFIWHRYYIPSYFAASMLAAFGAWRLVAHMPSRLHWLPVLIPVGAGVAGFAAADRSRYRIAEAYSRRLLESLPPGAHLAASDENILFVLLYLRLVEEMRSDVELIPQGIGEADLPPLRFDPDTDPLYLTHHPNWSVPGLEIVPSGLVFRTVRAGRPRPAPVSLPDQLDGETDPRVPKDYLTRNLVGEFHYMKGLGMESADWPRAALEFERAKRAAPDNDVLFYNLGLIYRRSGRLDEALEAFRRCDAINPRGIGRRQVLASERIREIEAALAAERTR